MWNENIYQPTAAIHIACFFNTETNAKNNQRVCQPNSTEKKAQQVTADIIHAALWCLYERKVVYLILVNFTNSCAKLAARNHISGPLCAT